MITGAQSLIKALEKHGVDLVFGYPGGTILPVYDQLFHSDIKHILTRSEQGAAHAASAYSRISGKVGVCLATSGPGATNLVTGIANAFLDSIPLIAITGQVSTALVGSDAFQEVDITGITQPIIKHNYLVTDAEDIAAIVDEAFYIASSGRPGPVLIDLPANIAQTLCSGKAPAELALPGYKPTVKGHKKQISQAAQALLAAEKPLLYIGGGAISAKIFDELIMVAEKLKAPVVTTLMGKGSFPEDHPLFLGMPGIHGHPAANLALCEADLVLAIGARFDERVTSKAEHFAKEAKIIHIDIDPAEISKNVASHIPIVGDSKHILPDLIEKLAAKEPQANWGKRFDELLAANQIMAKLAKPKPFNGRYIIDLMNKYTNKDTIVTVDVGQHQMWTAQYYKGGLGGRFLASGGLGCMGYGLPAALGAQLADAKAQVIAVCGDGGLQMSMNELATIAAHNLPVKLLLLNNNVLGMVRQLEHFNYNYREYYAIDLPGNPDFSHIAKAYGMDYYRINRAATAEEKLKQALTSDKSAFIEVIIPTHDFVLPMVKAGCPIDNMMFEG